MTEKLYDYLKTHFKTSDLQDVNEDVVDFLVFGYLVDDVVTLTRKVKELEMYASTLRNRVTMLESKVMEA